MLRAWVRQERESRTLLAVPRSRRRQIPRSILGGEDIRRDGINSLPSVTGLQRRVHSLLRSPLGVQRHAPRAAMTHSSQYEEQKKKKKLLSVQGCVLFPNVSRFACLFVFLSVKVSYNPGGAQTQGL